MRVGEFRGGPALDPWVGKGANPAVFASSTTTSSNSAFTKDSLGTHNKAITAYSLFKLQSMGIFLLLSTELSTPCYEGRRKVVTVFV